MRRLVLFSAILVALSVPMMISGQQQAQPAPEELIIVSRSSLTPQQLADAQARQQIQNLEQYTKWAQMGRAIGIGVQETLAAVTDETAKFAETDVGRLAMFLVAWKIMADDAPIIVDKVIGYLVGIPLFLFGSITILWSYRRMCVPRRVVAAETTEGGKKIKTYETHDPGTLNSGTWKWGKEEWMIAHAVVLGLLVIVCSVMIFAG